MGKYYILGPTVKGTTDVAFAVKHMEWGFRGICIFFKDLVKISINEKRFRSVGTNMQIDVISEEGCARFSKNSRKFKKIIAQNYNEN